MKKRRVFELLAVLLAGTSCVGCIKIKETVHLNEDGSGKVREVVEFGWKLLTLEEQLDLGCTINDRLSRESVEQRAAEIGKDVTVKRHEVKELPDGGKQLTVVYHFKEINDLRLTLYPIGKDWHEYDLRFQYETQRTNSRMHLTVIYGNFAAQRATKVGGRLLPIFKDMLEGFELSLKLEIYEREQWGTFAKGRIRPATPAWLRNGGRTTLLELTDDTLYTSDDALMVLLSWRQEGNERGMRALLDFPFAIPNCRKVVRFDWRYVQYPRRREYCDAW